MAVCAWRYSWQRVATCTVSVPPQKELRAAETHEEESFLSSANERNAVQCEWPSVQVSDHLALIPSAENAGQLEEPRLKHLEGMVPSPGLAL